MSPASKSKSKSASRVVKDQPQVSLNSSPLPGEDNLQSAYIPLLGTFHTFEKSPSFSAAVHDNGKFKGLDDGDDQSGSSYDSMSNNGSCSGESEDHKEKIVTSPIRQTAPATSTDKRDKIRQKNEKKHQRQKEKRAQELHERCSSYLMSRKLELLSQKLVAMGFSSERAITALLVNEGRLEESVTWLLANESKQEGGDESKQEALSNLDGVTLKIDIADELVRISEMEVRFKCTKQEVERAVVSCEGDLQKAEEAFQAQKQVTVTTSEKVVGNPSGSILANDLNKKLSVSGGDVVKAQLHGTLPVPVQQKLMDNNSGYMRPGVAGVGSQNFVLSRNSQLQQSSRIQQSGQEHTLTQELSSMEKQWPSTNYSLPVSYSTPPSVAVAQPVRLESQFVLLDSESQFNMHAGMPRQPIILMRSQSLNGKQNKAATSVNGFGSPPSSSTAWYSNGAQNMDVKQAMNGFLGQKPQNSPGLSFCGSIHQYHQNQFNQFPPSPTESDKTGRLGLGRAMGPSPTSSSLLRTPSSLGLFSNPSCGRSSDFLSAVDWSTGGLTPSIDNTSVDWSLQSTSLRNGWSSSHTRPATTIMGVGSPETLRKSRDNIVTGSAPPSSGLSEWSNPFEGRDLFRDPRQYVSFPYL